MRDRQTAMGAAAELTDVAVSIGGRSVLDGATLQLRRASVFLLLGENGAGKTTLMRTLCGRTSRHRGHVLVEGRDPRTDVEARSAIGFVPQSIALYPHLTVRENLKAFAAYGRRRVRPVEEVLRNVRLESVAQRIVEELSGGYQRRANLGAALVTTPGVLLLDEPTVGLDAAAKAVMVDVIREVTRSGVAILITTHDLDVAEAVADEVGVLAQGRIVEQGKPRDLLRKTFAGRFRLTFMPMTLPDADTVASFRAAGLRHSAASEAWHSQPDGADQDVVRMVTAVAAPDRLGARRLEIVEPGLRDLYDVLIGQERAGD